MKLSLENDFLLVEVSTFGGHIERIYNKVSGTEHYWSYDPRYWPRRTTVCFPICGGLTEDAYLFQNRRYSLPPHGFLRDSELSVVSHTPDRIIMELLWSQETYRVYPFHFRFRLICQLAEDVLEIRYVVDNIGRDTMYCSVGSHCTYLAPFSRNERREDCCLLFSGPQNAGRLILEGNQIVGKIADFFQGRQMLPLKGLFEQASIIMETADLTSPVISIFSSTSGVGTQVSFDGFRYCICWAPKGEDIPFVCIEPWTGMVDQAGHNMDLPQKLGISAISPGERMEKSLFVRPFGPHPAGAG